MEITGVNRLNTSCSSVGNNHRRRKFGSLFSTDPINLNYHKNDLNNDHHSSNHSSNSSVSTSPSSTIYTSNLSRKISSLSQNSLYVKSPWERQPESPEYEPKHCHIGSLLREESHIYSMAAVGDLLFIGSESKNVRVWKKLRDFSGFKSRSGMVKAIVVVGEKIFTGHQDGNIRVWTFSNDKRRNYTRIGTLPKTQDLLVKSMNPRNYVKVRRKKKVPWLKHYDTVSCMSVDADKGLLYSGGWDKTLKVWRIYDSKCLESITAHDDAVNAVVTASEELVFTGSADGTVKAWRLDFVGNRTKHSLVETLLKQEHAVTALAMIHASGVVYAGSSDGLLRFWEVETRPMAFHGVLRGHKMAVLCLVVAGNLVLSGSADKSICVWRRDGGKEHACVAVLSGHCAPVKCLAVQNDASTAEKVEKGRRRWTVYSGSLDKSVRIWRVSE